MKKLAVYFYLTNNINNKPWPEISITNPEMDYFMFTDDHNHIPDKRWNVVYIDAENDIYSKEDMNKKFKWNPFEFFEGKYEYSLYCDSKIKLVGDPMKCLDEYKDKLKIGFTCHKYGHIKNTKYIDNIKDVYKHADYILDVKVGHLDNIKKLKEDYKKDGFPENTGVVETAVILTNLNSKLAKRIQGEIFTEYINRNTKRDQLVVPYVLWKNNIPVDDVELFGNFEINRKNGKYFGVSSKTNVNNRNYNSAKYHNSKVVVSMTSWTKRIGNVKKIVESIMDNTKTPDVLYLNLSKTEFEGIPLPQDLVDYFNSNPRLIINWVDGENTKSMKKVFPILQYLNDEDIIITADDDIPFPKDLIESRLNDFYSYDRKYSITSNRSKTISLTGMYVASAVSLYEKKMLNNWEKYVNDMIIKTYNDDRTYLYIMWLNGYLNKPCSKYDVRELLRTYDLGLKETSMTINKTHIAGSNYDRVAFKRLSDIQNLSIDKMFGYFNNEPIKETEQVIMKNSRINQLKEDIKNGKVIRAYSPNGSGFVWKRVK